MRFLFGRLFRFFMDHIGRLLLHESINQEAYTHKDERYAEHLTDVDIEEMLKTDIGFLDKLNYETHTEAYDKE